MITEQKTETKPKIKRIKKSSGDSSKMYFNQDTQAAIVAYQVESDRRSRERIYVNEIMPAFKKLVENLINIHKFAGLHDSHDDLKDDCISFLFETIHKFDATRGTNAFSYFNVVAKNWLIIKTKQKNTHKKRNISINDSETMSSRDKVTINDFDSLPSQDIIFESFGYSGELLESLKDIRNYIRTENELACINSIITIFENIDDIDLLNKSAVLLYMRELSGLTPKQLMTSMQTIKKHYREIKLEKINE